MPFSVLLSRPVLSFDAEPSLSVERLTGAITDFTN